MNGASVEQIAGRAGFTRGAFYGNFADKHELVRELLRRPGLWRRRSRSPGGVVFDYLRGRKRWRNGADALRTAATDSEYQPAGTR